MLALQIQISLTTNAISTCLFLFRKRKSPFVINCIIIKRKKAELRSETEMSGDTSLSIQFIFTVNIESK
jgi:uncharacterized membrane protein